jgi:hypothetical protein
MTDVVSFLQRIVSANGLEGFNDVFWNMGQVVAWAETRSPFSVDAYSNSSKEFAQRDHSILPGLPHFAAEYAERCADRAGIAKIKLLEDVRTAVLRRLQSGLLVASGKRPGGCHREQITSLEWADLTLDDSLAGEMTVRHREGGAEAWNDVRIKREDLISAFPFPMFEPSTSTTSFDAVPGDARASSGDPTVRKPKRGKVPPIIDYLRKKYPNRVPDPALAPRKAMRRELISDIPQLGRKLDEQTLKNAIDEYNAGFRISDSGRI